jgi:phosphatidylcholine synthase
VDRETQGPPELCGVSQLGSIDSYPEFDTPAAAALAWLVHAYSASGVVLAFLALIFIDQGRIPAAFGLMLVAVAVDATDGTLARLARVKEVLPKFDGDRLEDIVDYLNYVLVPAFLLLRAGLLPQADALWLAALPLVASAYGFCQKEAKTADHYFLGFPSYWNVVVFYMYVLRMPPWLNAFLIILLAALVFVPIKYLYPSRNPAMRQWTVALGTVWAILIVVIIYSLPNPNPWVVLTSLFFPLYYLVLSFWLEFQNWRKKDVLRR